MRRWALLFRTGTSLLVARMWPKACRHEAVGSSVIVTYCLAGACHAGCGKSKSQCESDWKVFDENVVFKHCAIPLPIAKVIKMSPDPK